MYAFTYCAAAAQKVYILHKKPSLSGTLCAKPPPRACSIPVRASQSILRAVVSDARTSDFKHAPVGGYGETQPPSRADDAVGPGWNGLQQASDRAKAQDHRGQGRSAPFSSCTGPPST